LIRLLYSVVLVKQLNNLYDLTNELYSYSLWRRTLSHNSLLPDSFGFLGGTGLPHLIRCERSRLRCHGHSLLLSSYLCRIKWKENSSCSTCVHPLQDLTHLLLDCLASELLRRAIFSISSIFDLWSRPWGVARLLGFRGVPPCPHPRKGSDSITTTNYIAVLDLILVRLQSIFLAYQSLL